MYPGFSPSDDECLLVVEYFCQLFVWQDPFKVTVVIVCFGGGVTAHRHSGGHIAEKNKCKLDGE